jgi:hypothetical protein
MHIAFMFKLCFNLNYARSNACACQYITKLFCIQNSLFFGCDQFIESSLDVRVFKTNNRVASHAYMVPNIYCSPVTMNLSDTVFIVEIAHDWTVSRSHVHDARRLGYSAADKPVTSQTLCFSLWSCAEMLITAGGENVPNIPIENAVKQSLPAVSNCMLIGDKRRYLTMLITLKVSEVFFTLFIPNENNKTVALCRQVTSTLCVWSACC